MIVVDKPLWFDSCAVDSAVVLIKLALLFAIVFALARIVQRWLTSESNWAFTTAMVWFVGGGIVLLTIASVVWPFPPQIVRVALAGERVEIKVCRTWSEAGGTYGLNDVDFRYVREERGTRKNVHHMFVAQLQGDAEPLGEIEFVDNNRFDFSALRKIAPDAVEQYSRARLERRGY